MKVKENLEHILKELQDATFKIEEEQIENVLKLIAPDKKIFLTGKGRSGLAAKGFANRLMHLGFQAYVIGEISTPHTKAGDLLIITSGSGETDALVSIAKKSQRIWTISWTCYNESSNPHWGKCRWDDHTSR